MGHFGEEEDDLQHSVFWVTYSILCIGNLNGKTIYENKRKDWCSFDIVEIITGFSKIQGEAKR